MNKKIEVLIVAIVTFIILGIQVSKVIAVPENNFFYTNKKEISQGETLEMILDISKVRYDEFEFNLSTNLDTNSIIINENLEVESYNNDISINIDKSKINLNKITFCYQVPEESQVGTKIELIAQIKVKEENEQNNDNNNETNNTISEDEYKVVDNKTISISIIEKKQQDNQQKPDEIIDKDNNNMPNNPNDFNSFEGGDRLGDDFQNNEMIKGTETFGNNAADNMAKSMAGNKQISYTSNSMSLGNIPTQTETAVYNGSNNNYLSSLEIEGENLNRTFNKENTTYFVKTTDKDELDIEATSEDDSAKICITGNENLKKGDNKILISVTAENGDVRNYRIFVTNN